MPFVDEIVAQNCNHEVWRYEVALLIHEHNAVSITIIDDTYICACLFHELFQCYYVLMNQRVRLMIRECSIHLIEDVVVVCPENLLGIEGTHAVGQVECEFEVAVVPLVLEQEIEIVLVDVLQENFSWGGRYRSRFAGIDPSLDLSESGIVSDRQGVLAGDFHSVVLLRVV